MEKEHVRKNNKRKRILSVCIAIIFILCIGVPIIVKANSDIPQFDISISANPQSANIGEDIVVSGTITPKDLTTQVKPKEVVLVLDTSGSMQNKTNNSCNDFASYYCYECGKYINESQEEHRNEKPFKDHELIANGYCEKCNRYIYKTPEEHRAEGYFRYHNIIENGYCYTCGRYIIKDLEEHRNENPYKNHNVVNANYCTEHKTNMWHQDTKMHELKKSAITFIDKLKDTPNLKISIVTFNEGAQIKSDFSNDFSNLKKEINKLSAGGGTNIGGGLRQGAYLLSNSLSENSNAEKYVVFMSDGQPTDMYIKNYVYKDDNFIDSDYYTDITQKENGKIKNGIYYKYPLRYSKLIGEKIKAKGYTVYSIGYDLENANQADSTVDPDATVTLKDIHNSMTSKKENFFESSTGSLEKIFADIADKISYSATDVKLNLDFPSGIEIIGNQQVMPLENIVYKELYRDRDVITYHAQPIKFNFVIRGNTAGNFNLFNNAKLTFMWTGKQQELKVKDFNVSILDPKKPKITINANDSAKNIKYDSNLKENDTDENYKLYGKSNLTIDASGVDAKYLRYKFNKNNDNSSNKWKYLELNHENDIDKTKENYLTQMPYDVSNMPLRTNEEMWNNRNNVFKNPFLKNITQISTKVSNGMDYVEREQCEKEDGEMVFRWKPKTLFVENYDVSLYAPDYKEASKSWGYMTVPEDGEYIFKVISDDGFYGNITVDGESKVIGDAFRVKWCEDQPDPSQPIALKKNRYYPVYFEYFNWGGAACYKIECKKVGDTANYYREVSERGIKFYPSKSNLPILNANNGFMGSEVIDMPTEFGKYVFEYELVDYGDDEHCNNRNKGNGKFGTFEIEERFILNKYFSQNGIKKGNEIEIENNESFQVNYEVKPKDIPVSELYKGNNFNTPPEKLYIKYSILEDKLPEGLYTKTIIERYNIREENLTNIINLTKNNFEYKFNGSSYVAEPYIFTVEVQCRANVLKEIKFEKSGVLEYRDVSLDDNLRISLNQYFDDELNLKIKGESEIIKHGVVIDGSIKDPNYDKSEFDSLVFKKNIPYTLGFVIDAKGSNNNFTINSKNADISNVFIYELNSEGKIIDSSKMEFKDISNIGNENNGIGSYIKQGKKYAVVYCVKPKLDISIAEFIAKLDNGSSKNLKLNFDGNLPELF